MRKQIVIYGRTNAGKSALFNSILNQKRAIVSESPGTTTDPVEKAMELLPYGPVVLTDTAGLLDGSNLGMQREAATKRLLARTDLALYVIDSSSESEDTAFPAMRKMFEARKIPYIVVFSKTDLCSGKEAEFISEYGLTVPYFHVSVNDSNSVDTLKKIMAETLQNSQSEHPLLGGLLPRGSVILLVIPIDSEAPAGRLILPQVQTIRDALDNGLRCHIANEQTLLEALNDLKRVDLIITDSQVFGIVDKIVPREIPLTSFSMLLARQKGGFEELYEGARAFKKLRDGDRVLIAEACTHNHSHEDIARVKLPRAIQKYSGVKLDFEFASGRDFPEDLNSYAMIVHCGGCMMTTRAYASRLQSASEAGVPITNYGIALACASGILERSVEIWKV